MAEIVLTTVDRPLLVVVSAFSTLTRDLDAMSARAAAGALEEALSSLQGVAERHAAILPSHDATHAADVGAAFDEMTSLLRAMAVTRQRTPRIRDRFLAYGELLSLYASHAFLNAAGIPAVAVDVRTVLVTDETFGAAIPLEEKTRVHVHHHLLPLLQQHGIVITQGFVGCTEHGDTTTMGKESSNLTASFLGAMLKADEVVIWTDVEGVRSADPTVCTKTEVRAHLSYADARTAAHHGVKILYPTMIEPAEREHIPIRIAHAFAPSGEHTIISAGASSPGPIIVHESSVITTLFASRGAWLHAAAEIVTALHLDDAFSVNAGRDAGVATMSVPDTVTKEATRLFHRHLVEHI